MSTTKIIDWLGRIFKPPRAGTYTLDSYRAETDELVSLDAYALFTAVQLIAGLISGCEFRTFRDGKEIRGAEWCAFNVKPNRNQNAPEFKRELVSRMLLGGDVLCVQVEDQLIIAESFNRTEYALRDDVFEQVSRAGFQFSRSFRSSDVIYLRSPINAKSAWIQNVMMTYDKLMSSASTRFQNAGGERGILNISGVAQGQLDFEDKFNKLMNEYFKGYFSGKNAVLPLFDGYSYTAQSSGNSGTYTNDLTAIKTLTDEAVSRAAQVFGIPPSYIRGDAAGISDSQAAALTNCIKPFAEMISAELTGKKHSASEIMNGSRIVVDTGNIIYRDLIGSAVNADKLIASGWSPNEVRRALGAAPIDEPWAEQHYITKNYQTIDLALEGGDGNEE